jgi:hypothetical protein
MAIERVHIVDSDFEWLIAMEEWHGTACEEHDLPVV